ncbi:MAG TPA: hypothetical protein VN775_00150 [Opitutaceae bacterium]|nr:hypothetical protein [Opitutaceae bacterium]
MNLQPRAASCFVSGHTFREGDRVASLLARTEAGGVARYDALESLSGSLRPEGFVACRWLQTFRQRPKEDNPDRALKLTAETLFLTLADPATEATPETSRLVRFLALLLERKRLLRQRGRSPDGLRDLYEHSRTRQVYEVPAIDLSPEFFVAVREQLTVLVGEPKAPQSTPDVAAASGV